MTQALMYQTVDSAQNPTACVVWLHGLGATSDDFVPVVPQLGLGDLAVRFIFPQAPDRPVTVNQNWVMPAWYDITGFDVSSREDAVGLRQSQDQLNDLLNQQHAEFGDRVVLMGFSQGGALSLYAGLRHAERLAGIGSLSAYLPLADALTSEAEAMNQSTPILLMHGQHDDVVPMSWGQQACSQLKALGYKTHWEDYPMAHAVCEPQIKAIGDWLRQVFVD